MEEAIAYHAQFFTATILNWYHLLHNTERKHVIINSLKYLVENKRVKVYAFVIMPNHIHLIWQPINNHKREAVQRDFMKYTSQQLLKILRTQSPNELEKYRVNAKDRIYQVWQRNSLNKDLWSEPFFMQKLDYIHENPCQMHWQLAKTPEEYYFSSASFYEQQIDNFGFITHFSD